LFLYAERSSSKEKHGLSSNRGASMEGLEATGKRDRKLTEKMKEAVAGSSKVMGRGSRGGKGGGRGRGGRGMGRSSAGKDVEAPSFKVNGANLEDA